MAFLNTDVICPSSFFLFMPWLPSPQWSSPLHFSVSHFTLPVYENPYMIPISRTTTYLCSIYISHVSVVTPCRIFTPEDLELHMRVNLWCLSFYVWVTLLNNLFRCIDLLEIFILLYRWIISHCSCETHFHFIYSITLYSMHYIHVPIFFMYCTRLKDI